MENILEIKGLTKKFEGLIALDGVSLDIMRGKITSLIGPNGAGKTTFFNCVTGIHKPSSGEMHFKGGKLDLDRCKPHQIARAGIARTFQNIRLFANMTVVENVMTGMFFHSKSKIFEIAFNLKKYKNEENEILKDSLELLKFVGLSDKLYWLASNLSYGEQRKLEIARALATKPDLLLLDEPAAGMNATETVNLIDLIRKIRDNNITVFLIEHEMKVVMNISDNIFVLNYGKKIAEGTPVQVQKNRKVIEAYLGEVKV